MREPTRFETMNKKRQDKRKRFWKRVQILIALGMVVFVGYYIFVFATADAHRRSHNSTYTSNWSSYKSKGNGGGHGWGHYKNTTTTTEAPTTTTTLPPTTDTTSPPPTTEPPTTTTETPPPVTTTTSPPPTTTTLPPPTTTSTTAPPPTTTTTEPGDRSVYTLAINLDSGDTIEHALFTRDYLDTSSYGITGYGVSNITLSDIWFTNIARCIKLGSGPQATNALLEDIRVRDSYVGLFVANYSNSTFRNLDFEVLDWPGAKNHALYLERGNHNLKFYNTRLYGSQGQALHLYNGTGSDNILFDGLDISLTSSNPVVIDEYSWVTMRNVVSHSNHAFLSIYDTASNILVENFEIWAPSLVDIRSGSPKGIVFRNGIIHGSLGDTAGITFENVTVVP